MKEFTGWCITTVRTIRFTHNGFDISDNRMTKLEFDNSILGMSAKEFSTSETVGDIPHIRTLENVFIFDPDVIVATYTDWTGATPRTRIVVHRRFQVDASWKYNAKITYKEYVDQFDDTKILDDQVNAILEKLKMSDKSR